MKSEHPTEKGYEPAEKNESVEQEEGGQKGEIRTQSLNRAHIVGTCPADAGRYDEHRGSLKECRGARKK